jgi:hypothetical protein
MLRRTGHSRGKRPTPRATARVPTPLHATPALTKTREEPASSNRISYIDHHAILIKGKEQQCSMTPFFSMIGM